MLPNLRPRGIGEILDAAVALYREKFGVLVGLTLLVVIPVHVLNALILLSSQPDSVSYGPTGAQPVYDTTTNPWVPLAGNVVTLIVAVLSTALATAIVTRVVADTYLGSGTTPGEAFRFAFSRLGSLVGLSILGGIVVFIGLMMCGIPGIWLAVRWSVAVPALLLEGKRAGTALSRSFELTKRRWWTSFGLLLTGYLLTLVVSIGLGALLGVTVGVAVHGTAAIVLAQGVSGTIASALTTPFLAAAVVVLYFDLRIRAEGFDVQMALHQLDRARPSAPVLPAR